MLYENKAKMVVIQSYLKARKQEDEARKRIMSNRLRIYYEDWKSIIHSKLDELHIREIRDMMKASSDDSQNILRKVINEISVVYKEAPSRTFSDENNHYEGTGINRIMKTVNRYFNLVNDVGVMMLYNQRTDMIKPMILTPAVTTVVQRDDCLEEIEALWYEVEKGDTIGDDKKMYVYWSETEHFMFDDGMKIYPAIDGNKDMINPYGFIPVVWFHRDQPPGLFWNRDGNQGLVNGCVWNAVEKTWKKYYLQACSTKQPWVSGISGDFDREKAKHTGYIWKLPTGSQIGMLDYDMNFENLDRAIDKDTNDTLSDFGLSIDMFMVSPSEMSGKALQIKNRGLGDIRKDQEPIFRDGEMEMFDVFRKVWNMHKNPQISESVEMSIDYAELDSFLSDEEKKEAEWLDVKRGVLSLTQYYVNRNPDVSLKDAEKKIQENIKMLKELKGTGLTLDDLFKGGDEGEQSGFAEI